MPFNAGGSTTRTTKTSGGTTWASDAAAANPINATEFDTEAADIYAMLAKCITNDGNQTVTSDVSWNSHKITNLATPTASTDAANKSYVDTTAGSPINAQGTPYTAVMSDANKSLYFTASSASAFTIPANASVAYATGTYLTFINDAGTAASMTISITSDTLVLAGIGTTGSRTLAQFGIATAIKVAATRWIISGPGLTWMATHQQWISGAAQGQTIATGTIAFHTDGTCTLTGSGATASPSNWFSCQNADIGASYWINVTRTSGTGGVNFSHAQGVWTKISGLDILGAIGAIGGAGSCAGTYQIATDAGGGTVMASGTISCNNTI